MALPLPPILPPPPPYSSGEDPEREGRLARLDRDYHGSPWLTVLVHVSGFVAVFAGSLVAVGLVADLGGGAGGWGPYALLLSASVGAHLGFRVLRRHRRRAAGEGPVRPDRPGRLRRR